MNKIGIDYLIFSWDRINKITLLELIKQTQTLLTAF